MLPVTEFIKAYWKVLVTILLVALLIWQVPAVLNAWKKNRLVKQQTTILAKHAASIRADERARQESDSLNNFIKGREYENNHQLEKNSIHANTLPPVLLPVKPPHEQ